MFIENRPTDGLTQETAIRIARRCRHVIQAVPREEEWMDADLEFYRIAREELESYRARSRNERGTSSSDVPDETSVSTE